MNDREMLELAAKAAGIETSSMPDGILRNVTGMHPYMNIFSAPTWNPLTDDGDALRLAVKLHIMVCHRADGYINAGTADTMIMFPITDKEPCEAVRYAIVRAAAEIGKGMK